MNSLFSKVRLLSGKSQETENGEPMVFSLDSIQKDFFPCQLKHKFVLEKGLTDMLGCVKHLVYTGMAEINGIQCHGAIAIKIYSIDGALVNFQFIIPQENGSFAEVLALDADIDGCFARIGNADGPILVTQDWASGVSLHHATGHRVAVTLTAQNLSKVCKSLSAKYPNTQIIVCAADDRDVSNSTLDLAITAALENGALFAFPQFGDKRPENSSDFNDLYRLRGLEAVLRCVKAAVDDPTSGCGPVATYMEVRKLAKLGKVEYEQQRAASAKKLRMRTPFLDDLVETERRRQRAHEKIGNDSTTTEIAPWPNPVDGDALATETFQIITRFTVMHRYAVIAMMLWIFFAHLIRVAKVAPILALVSPVKRCGKTTALSLLELLVPNPITASNITPAALFRTVETMAPTLLMDEADTFIRKSEELNGIINSGHSKSNAYVIRIEDDKPRRFSTWCPKAIAMIGTPPETILDRSIIIRLRRKRDNEHVESLRYAPRSMFADLHSKIMRWALDNAEQLSTSRPEHIVLSNDRAKDNWEPLLLIASLLGQKWLKDAREAAIELSRHHEDDPSLDEELLSDIRQILDTQKADRIKTATLIASLCMDHEKPWKTFSRGSPISSRDLAALLKKFGIRSKNLRYADGVTKGYDANQFEDAFARYLPKQSG